MPAQVGSCWKAEKASEGPDARKCGVGKTLATHDVGRDNDAWPPGPPHPMDVLLLLLHLAAWLALAFGLALVRARPLAIGLLGAAAVAGVAHGLLGPDDRTLTTVHTYAGFQGIDQEISMVPFPTGTVTAPGWQWPLPFAGFAALWILVLWWLGRRELARALGLPLLFAWTATAAWLGMQACAAPAALVQPVGLDRFLWPAGLAAALVAAATARTFGALFVQVGVAVMLSRMPAAAFSKLASDQQLGTVLDISSVRDIVNPMTQMQFDPPLVAGSSQQQFWLIWLEHVIFFPAVYAMSLFGIAIGVWLFRRHPATP